MRIRVKALKSTDSSAADSAATQPTQNSLEDTNVSPPKKLRPDVASFVAAQKIESDFLNRTVLVHLPESQSRVFKGVFQCVDDGANVILSQAEEWTVRPAANSIVVRKTEDRVTGKRFMGMVMIQGSDVAKIEVEAGWQPFSGSTHSQWLTDPEAYA